MKKLVKRLSALGAMLIISTVAFSQSTTTQEAEQTTTPPTETTESTEDSTGAVEALPESTAVAPEGDPAAGAANEKPATRHKLYSGKQRGNNVIYDPKK